MLKADVADVLVALGRDFASLTAANTKRRVVMKLPAFDYQKPKSLSEAVGLLAERDKAQVMGGGSDVLFNMKLRLFEPETLISLDQVAELKTIEQTGDGAFTLGAGCTLADLVNHADLIKHQPTFVEAVKSVASWHIRNQATLGGNLCLDTRCWYTNQTQEWRNAREDCFKTGGDICHVIKSSPICVALNSSDIAPALMVLGAEMVLQNQKGERQLSLRDFYQPDGVDHTVRRADEILTRIHLPAETKPTAYLKIAPRKGMDFSHGTIAVALTFDGDSVATADMVIGSMAPQPVILKAASKHLQGKQLSEELLEEAAELAFEDMGVLTNLYTSSAHKKDLVRALIKKSLRTFMGENA